MPYLIGTPLLCINEEYTDEALKIIPNTPKKGKVYTVRNVIRTPMGWGIQLNEFMNPFLFHKRYGNFEPSFASHKFIIFPCMN